MFEERELIMLLLGIGALVLAVKNRGMLAYLRSPELLLASVSLVFLGWVSTNLEGLPGGAVFDSIEHACYGLSSLFIAIWAYRTATR